MRTIQRIISLEPMTSRLPGVLPAYKDNVLYYFDEDSLKAREYEFPSNYGMIPVNIVLDKAPSAATDWNLSYDSHCYGTTLETDRECYCNTRIYDNAPSGSGICGGSAISAYEDLGDINHPFVISWEELSDWYKFFTDYYHLLNDWGHCGIVYSSATQYYKAESKHGYAPQLKYGAEEQTYIDMDELFRARGGSAITVICDNTKDICNFDNCSAHTVISEAVDDGFYKWICEHIIPSFVIPNQYKDYWRRDKLFYPDVIKWRGWLEDRSGYGKDGLTIFDCSGSTDCCECEKWFKLGGNDILKQMNTWYEAIQKNIVPSIEKENCAIPTIIMPLSMQVSIDDLGEFSIFSKEYELGIDYRTAEGYGQSENTRHGTVVTMDKEAMILTGGSGFSYDTEYMEMFVSSCSTCGYEGEFTGHCPKCGSNAIIQVDWAKYNPELEQVACSFEEYDYAYREKNSGYTIDIKDTEGKPTYERSGYTQGQIFYYTFDDNDRRVTSSAETGLRQQLAIRYPIEKHDAILIGTSLYDIQKLEYGVYDGKNKYISGRTFFVYREEYTDTPYTIINGKRIYADFYPFSGACSQFYYFPFFKEKTNVDNDSTCSGSTLNPDIYKKFPRTSTTIEDYKEFITYMGTQHVIEEDEEGKPVLSGITINGIDYIRITSGTCIASDDLLYITNVIMVCDEESCHYEVSEDGGIIYHYDEGYVVELNDTEEKYEVDSKAFEVKKKVDDDIDVYLGGILSGTAESKLYDLRSTSLLTDDIGNTIEALYKIGTDTYNHQPPEGSKLEPIYQLGNVANVKRFSMTVEKQQDLMPNTPNYFIGDIITGMKFYYRDNEGNTIVYHEGEDDEISTVVEASTDKTSLEAIEEVQQKREEIEEAIRQASGSTFIFDDDIYCDVTYYIGATLVRNAENEPFKIVTGNNFSSGVCYTETVKFVETEVQYYLKTDVRKQIPMTQNTVSAHTLSYPIVCYVMTQDMTKVESDYNNYYYAALAHLEMPLKTNTNDFELYNGTSVFPVFREEYKMGTACIQNIDTDIYIDRGINAAFEKHLKLGEITSMEALEQYTNGYFKIMNN